VYGCQLWSVTCVLTLSASPPHSKGHLLCVCQSLILFLLFHNVLWVYCGRTKILEAFNSLLFINHRQQFSVFEQWLVWWYTEQVRSVKQEMKTHIIFWNNREFMSSFIAHLFVTHYILTLEMCLLLMNKIVLVSFNLTRILNLKFMWSRI